MNEDAVHIVLEEKYGIAEDCSEVMLMYRLW